MIHDTFLKHADQPAHLPTIWTLNGQPYIGMCFSLMLFGMNLKQAGEYFYNYPKDRLTFKATVMVISALNLGHSIAMFSTVYHWNVTLWRTSIFLRGVPSSFGITTVLGGSVVCLVQIFYGFRIYSALKFKPITIIICTLIFVGSLIACSMAYYYASLSFMIQHMYELGPYVWVAYVGFWVSAGVDILISIVLIFKLQRAKGIIAATNKSVNHIIRITLQTNLATAIVAIINGCLFFKYSTGWPFGLYFVLVKLYVMSAFSSLNGRPSHIRSSKSGLFLHREPLIVQREARPGSLSVSVSGSGGSSNEGGRRSSDRRLSSPRIPFRVFSLTTSSRERPLDQVVEQRASSS